MPPTLTPQQLAKMSPEAKELYYKMQGITHRPTVTDWTNDEQIKTAIMANINSDLYPAIQRQYPDMPDVSDALQIAHQVQFHEWGWHPHIVDIKRCLHQLVAENRIEYVSWMRDGKLREKYGPLVTTDAERAKWDLLRQRVANT